MTPGLMLLFSQSELLGSSSIDDGPDKFQHVKSVVTGIIAGLLLQIPLVCQIIIAPATSRNDPLPFSPYFLVYLLIVVTMAGIGMIVNRTLASPITMIATCLIGAWPLPFPKKTPRHRRQQQRHDDPAVRRARLVGDGSPEVEGRQVALPRAQGQRGRFLAVWWAFAATSSTGSDARSTGMPRRSRALAIRKSATLGLAGRIGPCR